MFQIQLINQVLLWERRLEIEENHSIHHEKAHSQGRSLLARVVRKVRRNLDSKVKFAKKPETSVYHCCCVDYIQKTKVS